MRDTLASVADLTRSAAIGELQQLQTASGGMQLVMGNNGFSPDLSLAPYVNGYEFECANAGWDFAIFGGSGVVRNTLATTSEAGWRTEFDAYRTMQVTVSVPRINILVAAA